jgi:CBS domain-containing protein
MQHSFFLQGGRPSNCSPWSFTSPTKRFFATNNPRNSLISLLKDTKARTLVDPRKALVVCRGNDTVSTTLEILSRANVWGSIVVDSKSPDLNHILGFVDSIDIATELTKKISETVDINSKSFTKEQIHKIQDTGREFTSEKCEYIINASHRDPLIYVYEDNPLYDTIKVLEGAHRVIVKKSNGEFLGVLAQMDVIDFLLSRHVFKGGNLDRPFKDLGLKPNSNVVSVTADTGVMTALKKIRDSKVSGLAVVEKDSNTLLTNFSASDFLGLSPNDFVLMARPVEEFLRQVHTILKAPVYCKETDQMEKILLQVNNHKVHRIYTTDDKLKPTGCISLTDIMVVLTQQK